MSEVLAALTEQNLLAELDAVERAIARSSTFHRWIDAAGRPQVRVSPDLLALAEREHHITNELKRPPVGLDRCLKQSATGSIE